MDMKEVKKTLARYIELYPDLPIIGTNYSTCQYGTLECLGKIIDCYITSYCTIKTDDGIEFFDENNKIDMERLADAYAEFSYWDKSYHSMADWLAEYGSPWEKAIIVKFE